MDIVDEFLKEKGISHEDKKNQANITYDKNQILNQIDVIVKFHKCTCNSSGEYLLALPNNLGKTMRKLSRQEKRNYKYFIEDTYNIEKDDFNKTIYNEFSYMFEDAYNVIHDIDKDKIYLSLLYRSMCNNEVCAGDIAMENLFYDEDEHLVINNTNKICLDMVEYDIISFILKLKKKNLDIDYDEAIEYFLSQEGLNNESYEFIKRLSNYPWILMRLCERKRESCDKYKDNYFEDKLKIYIRNLQRNKNIR